MNRDVNKLIITDSDTTTKKVIYARKNKERLTIQHFYASGKTVIQGKPGNIFNVFISYLTQLLDINEITPILNKCYFVDIEQERITKQYEVYLPCVPETISEKLKISLLQAIYNLNYSGTMFEYSHLTSPILRALEGHIKSILLIIKYDQRGMLLTVLI